MHYVQPVVSGGGCLYECISMGVSVWVCRCGHVIVGVSVLVSLSLCGCVSMGVNVGVSVWGGVSVCMSVLVTHLIHQHRHIHLTPTLTYTHRHAHTDTSI